VEGPLRAALRQAVAFLEGHGYRYAVIGGIANQRWGRARFTYDVDIKVLVPDTDYPAARAAIRSAFPERARPHVPANPLIVDTKVEEIIVDFLLTVPGYEENIITRAVCCDLDGLEVWICSPEDLIIQKAVAGRSQDWQDIKGVLAEQYEHLDQAYIEGWLQQFAEALDQPEILSQYRNIQERITAVLTQHDPDQHPPLSGIVSHPENRQA
jgi:predicted nucleotidyltransferase